MIWRRVQKGDSTARGLADRHRLRVQGGWVYRYRETALCFVPGSAYPFAPEAQEPDTSPPIGDTHTAPEAIGPTQATCGQIGCGAPATAWFEWPGRPRSVCCGSCLARALHVGGTMGFDPAWGPL